jgi:hypothetical protein
MSNRSKSLIILLLITIAQTAFGFGRFMYFTDLEVNPADDPGGEILLNYYGADNLYGPLHSNDYIKINGAAGGYPQFYGPVSTAKEDLMWVNGTTPNYDIFHDGFTANYPYSDGFPYPPVDDIQTIKDNSPIVIPDSAYVDSLELFFELATTLRIRDTEASVEQWLYDHFTPADDTIYCNQYYTPGEYLTLPEPENGTVYLPGKLFLEGRLEGQLTILASDTIWLIDDVYYADVAFDGVDWIGNPPEEEKGMPPVGSTNRLGIISEKNVIVAFNAQNGGYNGADGGPGGGCPATDGVADNESIVINAAVMALDNVFEADFWHNSCNDGAGNPYGLPTGNPCNTGVQDMRGNIYLWGSIIQQRRGFVRRSPIGPYGNRLIGYDKRYHYDENFAISYPPRFPELWDTLHVPQDFPTIQAAIDSVWIGDVILVDPGVYQENLVIDSKSVFLTSRYQLDGYSNCIEETVIDGSGAGAVILIRDCEYMSSRITGFTLTNGSGFQPDSSDYTYGGGICSFNSAFTLENLIITGNHATCGGGISVSGNVHESTFIRQVTVTGDTAGYGAGLFLDGGDVELQNCIFWNNHPTELYENDGHIRASCCDIQGGWQGWDIIDSYPRFCNPGGGDFRLHAYSPCRSDECGVMGYSAAACSGQDIGIAPRGCPDAVTLSQNYPNPFNPSTTIEFTLAHQQETGLVVYNTMGQKVATLADGMYAAGVHRMTFNTNLQYVGMGSPRPLPSGVYVYQLSTDHEVISRKMLLLK